MNEQAFSLNNRPCHIKSELMHMMQYDIKKIRAVLCHPSMAVYHCILAYGIESATAGILLFLTLYLTHFNHLSTATALSMLSYYAIGTLIGGIIGGKISDRLGGR